MLVLQAVAGIPTLTPEQRLAADVTGNGTFSSLDATRILQFQAGIITKFEAATACGSDWLFKPVPSPTPGQILTQPHVILGVCQPGQISLTGFTPPLAGRDFQAILLGDVTGNWTPCSDRWRDRHRGSAPSIAPDEIARKAHRAPSAMPTRGGLDSFGCKPL